MASFELAFGDAIVADMGAPLPWSDLEGPCATSLLWADAAAEVRQLKSHLIVTVISEAEAVEAATQLTKVTAAILGGCEHAAGVLWFNAALIVPKAPFLEMCETVLPCEPPVDIWVDFRVGRDGDHGSTGFTQGLRALGLMELEARQVPETVADLRDRLQNLARYLVENGPVIGDGHSLGYNAEERIRIVYGSSGFGSEGQVMHLHYETPRKNGLGSADRPGTTCVKLAASRAFDTPIAAAGHARCFASKLGPECENDTANARIPSHRLLHRGSSYSSFSDAKSGEPGASRDPSSGVERCSRPVAGAGPMHRRQAQGIW